MQPLLTQTVTEPYIKNPSCEEEAEKAKQADAERKDPDEPDKEVISHSSERLMIRSIRKLFKYLWGNNSVRITALLMKQRNQVLIACGRVSCVNSVFAAGSHNWSFCECVSLTVSCQTFRQPRSHLI